MSKRSMKKKIMAGAVILLLCGWFANESKASTVEKLTYDSIAYNEGDVNVCADTKVWIYKEVNGKKYMRLYDTQKEKWLTDWILCG